MTRLVDGVPRGFSIRDVAGDRDPVGVVADRQRPSDADDGISGATVTVDQARADALRRAGDDRDRVIAYVSLSGIDSASAARLGAGSKGSAKYWVSCATNPSVNSMMLTERVGTPS